MANDITLSSATRSNLLSLQNTSSLIGTTQQRLATGLKVNSALDDALAAQGIAPRPLRAQPLTFVRRPTEKAA